jgi:hypothetical protein
MGVIRKISIGPDYKTGAMHYIVGQKVLNDTHEIHHIEQLNPERSVRIFIVNQKSEVLLWKEFGGAVPVSIEYNVDI